MTDPAAPRDDFDRIVEGLDLDLTGLEDFDRSAAQAAAARERAELEAEQRRAAEPEEQDDQFYREVGPADLPTDRRTTTAWLVILGGPALLILARIAGMTPPPVLVATAVIAAVCAVAYLIARLPDRGPSNPDWPDDGAAL